MTGTHLYDEDRTDTDYDRSYYRPRHSRARRIGLILLTVAAVLVFAGFGLRALGDHNRKDVSLPPSNTSSPVVPLVKNSPVAVANDQQTAMLTQFRLATPDETDVIQNLPDMLGDPAAAHVYVAVNASIELVAIETPMTLIIPDGVRWTSGPMSMITILKVPSTSLQDLQKSGALFSDPMCTLQLQGVLAGDCTSDAVRKAGDWNEMMTHLRRPTVAELKSFLAPEFHGSADVNDYYIATSDVRLAPEYRFYEVPGNVLGILIPHGVKVLGGEIGYMDVITGPYSNSALDTICFMYGGYAPLRPQTFAPDAEIKRVQQGCAR